MAQFGDVSETLRVLEERRKQNEKMSREKLEALTAEYMRSPLYRKVTEVSGRVADKPLPGSGSTPKPSFSLRNVAAAGLREQDSLRASLIDRQSAGTFDESKADSAANFIKGLDQDLRKAFYDRSPNATANWIRMVVALDFMCSLFFANNGVNGSIIFWCLLTGQKIPAEIYDEDLIQSISNHWYAYVGGILQIYSNLKADLFTLCIAAEAKDVMDDKSINLEGRKKQLYNFIQYVCAPVHYTALALPDLALLFKLIGHWCGVDDSSIFSGISAGVSAVGTGAIADPYYFLMCNPMRRKMFTKASALINNPYYSKKEHKAEIMQVGLNSLTVALQRTGLALISTMASIKNINSRLSIKDWAIRGPSIVVAILGLFEILATRPFKEMETILPYKQSVTDLMDLKEKVFKDPAIYAQLEKARLAVAFVVNTVESGAWAYIINKLVTDVFCPFLTDFIGGDKKYWQMAASFIDYGIAFVFAGLRLEVDVKTLLCKAIRAEEIKRGVSEKDSYVMVQKVEQEAKLPEQAAKSTEVDEEVLKNAITARKETILNEIIKILKENGNYEGWAYYHLVQSRLLRVISGFGTIASIFAGIFDLELPADMVLAIGLALNIRGSSNEILNFVPYMETALAQYDARDEIEAQVKIREWLVANKEDPTQIGCCKNNLFNGPGMWVLDQIPLPVLEHALTKIRDKFSKTNKVADPEAYEPVTASPKDDPADAAELGLMSHTTGSGEGTFAALPREGQTGDEKENGKPSVAMLLGKMDSALASNTIPEFSALYTKGDRAGSVQEDPEAAPKPAPEGPARTCVIL